MKRFRRGLSLFLALVMLLPVVCLGYTPDVHAAGASSYISSTYPANLSVKTTRVVNLMEFPSTSSTGKYTLPVDTMLTVKALHKNTSGTYWYEVLYYDMTLYIEAAAATLVDHLTGDVRVEDLFSPAALGLGQGFPIGGTITSSLNKLGTVTAAMHYNSNIAGAPAISSSDTVNGYSYKLDSSKVDVNLIFSDLSAGSYTYLLTVEAISYYINDKGALSTSTQTVVLENKPCVVTNASSPNAVVAKGIDVSVHNGYIDWAKVATQVDFAILRIGYLCVQNGVGHAYVEGTKWYRVDFHFNDGMMTDIYCDCPYSDLCKHEVAVAITLRMLFKHPQFKNAGDFMALDRWVFWQLASRADSITI